MICAITADFDTTTVERFQARRDWVERDHDVRQLWMVESGSRA